MRKEKSFLKLEHLFRWLSAFCALLPAFPELALSLLCPLLFQSFFIFALPPAFPELASSLLCPLLFQSLLHLCFAPCFSRWSLCLCFPPAFPALCPSRIGCWCALPTAFPGARFFCLCLATSFSRGPCVCALPLVFVLCPLLF